MNTVAKLCSFPIRMHLTQKRQNCLGMWMAYQPVRHLSHDKHIKMRSEFHAVARHTSPYESCFMVLGFCNFPAVVRPEMPHRNTWFFDHHAKERQVMWVKEIFLWNWLRPIVYRIFYTVIINKDRKISEANRQMIELLRHGGEWVYFILYDIWPQSMLQMSEATPVE